MDAEAGQGTTERFVFWTIVAVAGMLPWLAPRPPMVDLPQHAAQIVSAVDLIRGHVLSIEVLTPYLVGYGLAALLSLVVPVIAALKLLLTASFYACVLTSVRLRLTFGGDPRLDWLFIPGFFGYAYTWGFVPYLVAAPIGLAFLVTALAHSERPTRATAWRVVWLGGLVFLAHGLVFVLVAGAGALFLVVRLDSVRRAVRPLAPYLVLALGLSVYVVYARSLQGPAADAFWAWNLGPGRLAAFLVYPWGTGENWPFAFASLAMLAAPFLIGSRRQGDPRAFAPFGFVLVLGMITPDHAWRASAMYERLGLFMLPFYALMFRARPHEASVRARRLAATGVRLALPAACCLFLATQADATVRFWHEAADFDAVLGAVPPGRVALALVFDPGSAAANNDRAYLHFPLWYMAERGGPS